MARLLQIGIINHADDQGRLKANPLYLRSIIFPYDNIEPSDITQWLELVARNETVIVYDVDGKAYLQLTKWWQYQSHSFASASSHPRPPGWTDRIRYTGKGRTIYTCNWISSTGELLPDTCDQDGNPIAKKPPSQPHGGPHGQSHGQPHGTLKEDKDKDKDKEEENAGAQDNEATQGAQGSRLLSDSDKDFGELCRRYEQEFGMISSHIADELNALLEEYKSKDMIIDAFAVAVEANKRTISYVKGCLRNWRSEGKGGRTKTPAKVAPKPLVMGAVTDNPFTLH
jgi:DnaD/phage-associated family protein